MKCPLTSYIQKKEKNTRFLEKTLDLHSQIVEVFRYYIDKMKGNKPLTQKEDRFKSQKPKGITIMKQSSVVAVVAERFSVDFIGKKISGTKASFDKAKRGSGPIYEELARKVANHPDFSLVEILPKKPTKVKETYKGMDIPWMLNYIEMTGDKAFQDKINKVVQFAKNGKKKPYPLAKKYFLKHFTDNNGVVSFDYDEAKAKVEEYLVNKTKLNQAKSKTENNTSSIATNEIAPSANSSSGTIIPSPSSALAPVSGL